MPWNGWQDEIAAREAIERVLTDAWFDALTAALMELFEAESLTERVQQ